MRTLECKNIHEAVSLRQPFCAADFFRSGRRIHEVAEKTGRFPGEAGFAGKKRPAATRVPGEEILAGKKRPNHSHIPAEPALTGNFSPTNVSIQLS